MEKAYMVERIENGFKVTGPTLDKPAYRPTRTKALRRVLTEVNAVTREESGPIKITVS